MVKNSVYNLRRKDKLLKKKMGRLEKKDSSLLDIVKELKNKYLRLENEVLISRYVVVSVRPFKYSYFHKKRFYPFFMYLLVILNDILCS